MFEAERLGPQQRGTSELGTPFLLSDAERLTSIFKERWISRLQFHLVHHGSEILLSGLPAARSSLHARGMHPVAWH